MYADSFLMARNLMEQQAGVETKIFLSAVTLDCPAYLEWLLPSSLVKSATEISYLEETFGKCMYRGRPLPILAPFPHGF